MKALVVFAVFGLALANGFRLPFRVFGDEHLRKAEMRNLKMTQNQGKHKDTITKKKAEKRTLKCSRLSYMP